MAWLRRAPRICRTERTNGIKEASGNKGSDERMSVASGKSVVRVATSDLSQPTLLRTLHNYGIATARRE